MAIKDHLKGMWRFYLSISILLLSVILSIGGVIVAIKVTHCDGDGGRGGAIADALALLVIFLDRSYASKFMTLIAKFQPDEETNHVPLDRKHVRAIAVNEIKRFAKLLDSDARRLRLQNAFLAIATFIGTLFWGFGDLIARHYVGKCS